MHTDWKETGMKRYRRKEDMHRDWKKTKDKE